MKHLVIGLILASTMLIISNLVNDDAESYNNIQEQVNELDSSAGVDALMQQSQIMLAKKLHEVKTHMKSKFIRAPGIHQLEGEPSPGLRWLPPATCCEGSGVVMALAAYKNNIMQKYNYFVGSLRASGFTGYIILGVHPEISTEEESYLKWMNVTMYNVYSAPCVLPFKVKDEGGNYEIRNKCSKYNPMLKLEWARYEMALQWLKTCTSFRPESSCTGWAMVCDFKDVMFQKHPFADLGEPQHAAHDLFLIEEKHKKSDKDTGINTDHWFATGSLINCYGKARAKQMLPAGAPMICSGTTVGTRTGLLRYLTVITSSFYDHVDKGSECIPPRAVDQPIHQLLWYQGKYGNGLKSATAMKYGEGPVLTVGALCARKNDLLDLQESTVNFRIDHAQEGGVDSGGLFLRDDNSIAPVIHQWDRCKKFYNGIAQKRCEAAHSILGYKPPNNGALACATKFS